MLQPITKAEFQKIAGPAAMHAIGHVAANLSFAAVAISLTHTVKTLEPVFSVALSKLVLGTSTPLPVIGTLVPIMVRIASAFLRCKNLSIIMTMLTGAFHTNTAVDHCSPAGVCICRNALGKAGANGHVCVALHLCQARSQPVQSHLACQLACHEDIPLAPLPTPCPLQDPSVPGSSCNSFGTHT